MFDGKEYRTTQEQGGFAHSLGALDGSQVSRLGVFGFQEGDVELSRSIECSGDLVGTCGQGRLAECSAQVAERR